MSADSKLCTDLPATIVLSGYALSLYRQTKGSQPLGKMLSDTDKLTTLLD